MLNEDEQTINSSPKSWLWSDCKLVLRRTNPKNPSEQSYENLQAEVQLQCQQIPEPFIPILTFEKPFIHNPTEGYCWKKGIPLPTLTVKLQESYFELLKQDEDIIMIYCEITVTYPNRKQTHFYLQETRTLGEKKKMFSEQGVAQFSGILLKECSPHRGNNKFSILIKICASSQQENRIILKTLISTAFYVFNSRIKRKIRKTKMSMKLISPKKFLKPLGDLKSFQQNFNKEDILNFLRHCNKNARHLSLTHPLYLIYHYSEVLKLYYNSKEVTDLFELLQVIAPNMGSQDKFLNPKSSFVSYQLKKNKSIKKSKQIQNKKIKNKLTIQAQINQGIGSQKKLLLVTFNQELINHINNIMILQRNSNQTSSFQSYLLKQIQNLTTVFEKWTHFCLEIDLLRQEPESVYWKNIHKDKVYEAYSKHYQMTKNRLTISQNNTVTIMDGENHEQNSY